MKMKLVAETVFLTYDKKNVVHEAMIQREVIGDSIHAQDVQLNPYDLDQSDIEKFPLNTGGMECKEDDTGLYFVLTFTSAAGHMITDTFEPAELRDRIDRERIISCKLLPEFNGKIETFGDLYRYPADDTTEIIVRNGRDEYIMDTFFVRDDVVYIFVDLGMDDPMETLGDIRLNFESEAGENHWKDLHVAAAEKLGRCPLKFCVGQVDTRKFPWDTFDIAEAKMEEGKLYLTIKPTKKV